jgi:hypothetical protein
MTEPEVTICPNFLPTTTATELYQQLCDRIDWDLRMSARKTACYGLSYDYSGVSYDNKPMHPLLVPLCNKLEEKLGFEPNSCLINYYVDGRSKMGFHSDEIDNLERSPKFLGSIESRLRSSTELPLTAWLANVHEPPHPRILESRHQTCQCYRRAHQPYIPPDRRRIDILLYI